MFRHVSLVPASSAVKAFGLSHEEVLEAVVQGNEVEVAHGYDAQCAAYFCDLMPDCEKGIYYGAIGLSKRLTKGEYYEAMKVLGLEQAADAVAFDLPY